LTGGGKADRFELGVDGLLDTITDFQNGLDLIVLTGVTFSDLTLIDQSPGQVRVNYAGDRVIVRDSDGLLTRADLTEDDFVFV
jgi:Ca2+-binding RTX toxin-like protein